MIKILCVTLSLFVGVAASAQEAPTFEQIVDGAKQEGKLTVWGSSPNKAETYEALFDAFNKRFGLQIKAEYLPINGARARPRIIAESAAGSVSVDIVAGESADGTMLMAQGGYVKPFPWKKVFEKQLPGIDAAYFSIPELDGAALTFLDGMSGIAWNTNLISADQVPDTWDEMTDKRYIGKIGLNAFLLAPIDTTAYARSSDQVLEIAKKLLANKPRLENGAPAVIAAVSAGTVPFGVTSYHHAMRAKENGEPVEFKFFSDWIPLSPLCVYVVEKAPHPNAARLFAAWFVTEGRNIATRYEPIPSLADKDSDFAKTVDAHVIKTNAKISRPNSAKGIQDVMDLREKLQTLMTLAQ